MLALLYEESTLTVFATLVLCDASGGRGLHWLVAPLLFLKKGGHRRVALWMVVVHTVPLYLKLR